MTDGATTESKQLWMVNPYASPPSIPGGTRHHETGLILGEHGWNARVIATPFNHKTHTMDREVSIRRWHLDMAEDGVDFTWVYSVPYKQNDVRRYVNMASFLLTSQLRLRGRTKPDVVLGSSPHLLSALSGWLMSKRFRVPFVMEVRDLWPESLVQLGLTNPVVIRSLEFLESFLYRQADSIVCLTEGIGENIRSRVKESAKVHVLPNAVRKPTRLSPERRAEVRDRLGWSPGEIIAIYAGAHGDANDLGQIVAAARELDDDDDAGIRFVLIGDGPTKADLVKQAEGLKNIDFLDAVPKNNVVEILHSADIGLLTLRPVPLFEGARPNKLFDYMGASLPVLSTVKGEAEVVLKESGAGIAVSPGELARAVADLAADVAARERMAEAGFHRSSSVQTREEIVKEFAALLDQLTAGSVLPRNGK